MTITVISVETDVGAYAHSALDVSDEAARECAERLFADNKPLQGSFVRTVALIRGRRVLDVFDGEWSSLREID